MPLTREQLIAWLEQAVRNWRADVSLDKEERNAVADRYEAIAVMLKAQSPVVGEIAAERQRQDEQWGGPTHDDTHTDRDWFFYIGKQQANYARGKQDARQAFIKIAALAVAAVESIDRNARGEAK